MAKTTQQSLGFRGLGSPNIKYSPVYVTVYRNGDDSCYGGWGGSHTRGR